MALFAVHDRVIPHKLFIPSISTDSPPVYPTQWIIDNPGQKPPINIIAGEPNLLYHDICLMIQTNIWDDKVVSSYMCSIILENPQIFSEVLLSDWKSYELVIGKKNDRVTPLNVLSLDTEARDGDLDNLKPSTPSSRLSLFYGLVLIYRKATTRSTNEVYGTTISKRLNTFFQSNRLNMNAQEIEKLAGFNSEDSLTTCYKKIICAIDMFFFRFPNSPYTQMRMATLPTRYKGCSALTSIGQVAEAAGIKPSDLGIFIYSNPVSIDFARVSCADQGLDDLTGYFPYQLEMDLTARSAYSISANPSLYLWLHTIGSVLGISRSYNARMPGSPSDMMSTVTSAAAVGLHFAQGSGYGRKFALSEKAAKDYKKDSDDAAKALRLAMDDNETEEGAEVEGPPEVEGGPGLDPRTMDDRSNVVLSNLIENEGLTEYEKDVLRRKTKACKELSVGTIGQYLSNAF